MKISYYISVFIIFVILGFFVITYASGYKIDITNRTLNPTGFISVETRDAEVYLNGEIQKETSGKYAFRNLKPGEYEVTVKREGYQDWTKKFQLGPGEAKVLNEVIQFKTSPTIEEYSLEQKDFFEKLADRDSIFAQNGEIYQNGNFVTRFSSQVDGLCWYPDRRYLAFTYEDNLKIIQIDGTNEINLVEKKSKTPVVFINSGRAVIYESDGKIFKAIIR